MNTHYSLGGKIGEGALTVQVWHPPKKAARWIIAGCLERPQRDKVMQKTANNNLAFWREERSLQWEERSTSNQKKPPPFSCQHWHPAELHDLENCQPHTCNFHATWTLQCFSFYWVGPGLHCTKLISGWRVTHLVWAHSFKTFTYVKISFGYVENLALPKQ